MYDLLKCGVSCYSNFLKICLEYNNNIVFYSRKVFNFDDLMIKEIEYLALKLKKDFKDIKSLCVLRGPGRFTAIRTVFTFASVYSSISGCEVYGVDLFGCLSYNIFEYDNSDKDIAIISHAFRDEYYLAFYKISRKRLFQLTKPQWLFFNEIVEKLKSFDGFLIYDRDEFEFDISKINNKKIKLPHSKIMRVIPRNIIRSSLYFKNKNYEPIYLKPAKFEIK